MQVYISYSRKDRELAERIRSALATQEINVWFDVDDIPTGDDWRKEITAAIDRSDAVIYIVSRASIESRWLNDELDYAMSRNKRIVPILVEKVPFDLLPAYLSSLQYVDFTRGFDSDEIVSLYRALEVVGSPGVRRLRGPIFSPRVALGLALLLGLALVLIALWLSPDVRALLGLQPGGDTSTTTPPTEVGDAPTHTPTLTLSPSPSQTATSELTPPSNQLETLVAQYVEETLNARPSPTARDTPTPTSTPTWTIQEIVNATVNTIRATEERVLSPQEASGLAQTAIELNQRNFATTSLLVVIAFGLINLFLVLMTSTSGPLRRFLSSLSRIQSRVEKPEPLLEDYQVFMSSSEQDKDWVQRLVKDLTQLGYLIWWYAKDGRGKQFGEEIKSAIYYTKVFVIVLSPDSMKSKHIEEEIRWAEYYNRPIINAVYRPIGVAQRFYGLAKGADIDFSNERAYKEAVESLTEVIEDTLKKRLTQAVSDEKPVKDPSSDN